MSQPTETREERERRLSRERYARNKDAILARKKIYYLANRSEIRLKQKINWPLAYERSKERRKEYYVKWHNANREKVRANHRRWRKRNKPWTRDAAKEQMRRWRKANPERVKEIGRRAGLQYIANRRLDREWLQLLAATWKLAQIKPNQT